MNILSHRSLSYYLYKGRNYLFSRDFVRNSSDGSNSQNSEFDGDEEKNVISEEKTTKDSQNRYNLTPRRTKSRELSTSGDRNHPKPKTFRIPILEMRDHIFPTFEKLVRRADVSSALFSTVPPQVQRIGYFIRKDGLTSKKDLSHLYDIGVLASYESWPSPPVDSGYVLFKAHQRLRRLSNEMDELCDVDHVDGVLKEHTCQTIVDPSVPVTSDIRILCYNIMSLIKKLQPFFPSYSVTSELDAKTLNPVYWSYCCGDFTIPSESARLQAILDEDNLTERLRKTLKILQDEIHFFSISSQINQKINENDLRESYLYNLSRLKGYVDQAIHHFQNANKQNTETTRTSSTLFGSSSKPESHFEKKIKERLKNLVLPEQVQTIVNEELARISSVDKSSVEYGLIQSYLDNLTNVPWGVYSHTDTTLAYARDILNEDHYGLEEVKETILEHLAVSSRLEKTKGRILCFVGPPGVGKTSIAKSIARALNRAYVRISVGGIDDACEIKGHRRTYIGALPGKIIKGLQLAKTMDPVFCVDEIDKMVRTHRGDPNGSLLEAFDPEQNYNFSDLYLDVPCDLSRVIFVCTANSTKNMTQPLLDRMDIIKLSGYTGEEKMKIIQNYILPSTVNSFNLKDIYGKDIIIDQEVFQRLTNEYFLEAGIRKTKNCIEKIIRKAVKTIDIGDSKHVHISLDNITDFAGYPDQPIRRPEGFGTVGLVTGLSASESFATGFTLDIECEFIKRSKGTGDQLKPTGLLGKSLTESSSVAFIVAKKILAQIDPNNTQLDENEVRIHFLEGGTPKDGPSAGVAIFSAVMSQALNIPVSSNLAMTGEMSLKGKVMAVGGIKEKVTAALRTGIDRIILPSENIPQFKQLGDIIKSKVNITFVSNVNDLMDAVFPTLSTQQDQNNITNQTTN